MAELTKVEDLRYPRRGYAFTIERRKGPAPSPASGPAMKGLHEYNLNLEELDEFVTALLTGRVTPEWIKMLLRTAEAKAQYERENVHPFAK